MWGTEHKDNLKKNDSLYSLIDDIIYDLNEEFECEWTQVLVSWKTKKLSNPHIWITKLKDESSSTEMEQSTTYASTIVSSMIEIPKTKNARGVRKTEG